MSHQTLNLTATLYDYLVSVSLREHPILKALRKKTATLPTYTMQISPEQGQFMALLIELIAARKTLEIGVYTGYSSLAVALALPADGKIIACDIDPNVTTIAQHFWEKARVANKIELRLAPALETLDNLLKQGEANSFDFIFIDADKKNYSYYYEQSFKLTRPGGVILIDNVLWDGKVADPQYTDKQTEAIRALNQQIHKDPRIRMSLLPLGDGLTLIRKQ